MVCAPISLSPFALKAYEKIAWFYFPPLPHHADCTVTQHIVISHCKHQSPLNQLDYLLYSCRHHPRCNTPVGKNGLCILLDNPHGRMTFLWFLLFLFMCSLLKSEQEKTENLHLCNIYDSKYISVLFETPRITVCAVYTALHIGHGTSFWRGSLALSKKQEKVKYTLI